MHVCTLHAAGSYHSAKLWERMDPITWTLSHGPYHMGTTSSTSPLKLGPVGRRHPLRLSRQVVWVACVRACVKQEREIHPCSKRKIHPYSKREIHPYSVIKVMGPKSMPTVIQR